MFVDTNGVLKQIRRQKGLSVKEVSAKTHISANQINLYESGLREINIAYLEAFCTLYGTTTTIVTGKSVVDLVAEMSVGEKIGYYRRKAGLTQKQVADKIEKNSTFISDCENGYYTPPIILLRKMAVVFNIPFEALINNRSTSNESFSSRFITLKEEKKASNRTIAQETGVSEKVVCLCNNIDYIPELYVIKRFADYFDVPIQELNDGMSLKDSYEIMTIAERIRFARKIKGLSQSELAKKINSDKQTIINYEQPNRARYHKSTLNKIAIALDISKF